MRRFLGLLVAMSVVMSSTLASANLQYFKKTALTSTTAGSPKTGDPIDVGTAISGSVQCVWSSLTGTLDGQFIVEIRNSASASWTPKATATIDVSGANGSDYISFNGNVTEFQYHVVWDNNGVTGGTVNCYTEFKG